MSSGTRGFLVEFNLNPDAIVLPFQYNPETLTRTRGTELTINNAPGVGTNFMFTLPSQTPRIMQGAALQEETLTVEVLFVAADYADREKRALGPEGIQPVLDALRLLVEPRSQKEGGMRILSELGLTGARAFDRDVTPSVLLFIWGTQVLPVVLKSVSYTVDEFLPTLAPIRAKAQLTLLVIEAHNPIIFADKLRQQISAGAMKGRPGQTSAAEAIASAMRGR
jgi:hypothetical protein